jgi:uncharacterized iron-regulated membrane protein
MRFTSDLVHHPRRLRLRRAAFQIHLWAGVLLAAYLVLIALSGSVLVYKDELTRWSLPSGLHSYQPVHTASVQIVLAQLMATEPNSVVTNLQLPSTLLPAFLLEGKHGATQPARWVADPVTGRVYRAPRTWLDTVHDLHYYLLLPHTWGMQVNSAGAAILLLLAATGLFLWWPGMRLWTRGLRVNFRANWRRVNYDLHSSIGFGTLAIVVWWAISGVYFGCYREVSAVVAWFSPLQGMKAPSPIPYPPAPTGSHAPLAQIIQAAQSASPHGRLWSVSDPSLRTRESYVLLDRGAPGDFSHRDIVLIRSADARVLSVRHYGERHSIGDWILWSMHPLHFGTLWGPEVKLIWCLLGLSLAVLTITGVLMYWNRYLRRMRFPSVR